MEMRTPPLHAGQLSRLSTGEPPVPSNGETPLLPTDRLRYWAEKTPHRTYLIQPKGGVIHTIDWRTAFDESQSVAAAIQRLGLPQKCTIAILSKNCAHWLLADYAIWLSGNVSVPLYPNLHPDTLRQILIHSETKLLFVGKLDNWETLKVGIPENLPLITLPYNVSTPAISWNDCVRIKQKPFTREPLKPDDLATIIYTSGTTGEQKGVMHSFRSIAFATENIARGVGVTEKDRFFSYLPLAHVAERVITENIVLYCGGSISFAESLETFAGDLVRAHPTIFMGVPRIWIKFQTGVYEKVPKLDRLLQIPILSMIVRRKILKKLGLSHCRLAITGAAPIPLSLLEWYSSLGLELNEAYGLTENFAYSHFNLPGKRKRGSVGLPWPSVEVRIGEDGEIGVRSPITMLGYFKNPEATRAAIRDGFLLTGDKGSVDADGFLWITGRVKEIFKTSKGKYVAPSPIESKILGSQAIEQCCVVGLGLGQPLALIVLSALGKKTPSESLTSQLKAHLEQINSTLDPHERVRSIVVTPDEWTTENGVLTPTMKVKRNQIEKRYGAQFEKWSNTDAPVIWQS